MNRIVVCCTSIPSRLKLLDIPILSMQKQTMKPDKIFIFLPEFSKKENCKYPKVSYPYHNVEVITTKDDYGPITKLYPITQMSKEEMGFHHNDEVLIINIDDDRDYSQDTIESLYETHLKLKDTGYCSIGIAGWIYGKGYEKWIKVYSPDKIVMVDWLEASYGLLYNYDDVKEVGNQLIDFSLLPDAKYCDDIWIAFWLKQYFPTKAASYATRLKSYNPLNQNYQELQSSTEAKFINALHNNIKDEKDINSPSLFSGIAATGYRYIKIASILNKMGTTPFLNSNPIQNTRSTNFLWLIIGYTLLIVIMMVVIILIFKAAFKVFKNKSRVNIP